MKCRPTSWKYQHYPTFCLVPTRFTKPMMKTFRKKSMDVELVSLQFADIEAAKKLRSVPVVKTGNTTWFVLVCA